MGRAGALIVLLLCGCPAPSPPDEDGGQLTGDPLWADGAVALGTLVSATRPTFMVLPAQLELQPGAQGGFHVELAFRVAGHIEPQAVFNHRLTRVRDGVLVSKGTRTFDVAPDATGTWLSPDSVPLFLCPTPIGVNVVDEALNFEVTVSRRPGLLLGRVTVQAVVTCPAGARALCESVCRG